MAKDRVVETYRTHELVVAARGSSFQGRVWKDAKDVGDAEGSSLSEVLLKLKDLVDSRLGTAAAKAPKPTAKAYLAALRKILPTLSDGHLAMLKAHYHAPNRVLTATQLAEAAGYSGYEAVNLQYGLVGRKLWDEIPTRIATDGDGSPIYTFALADGDRSGPEAEWKWVLRSEVAAAIKELGLDR